MISLPSFADYDTYRTWRADTSQWLPVARDIARGHGLNDAISQVFATGTNIVVALDGRIVIRQATRARIVRSLATAARFGRMLLRWSAR